jgi:rod shape-determining protein MreC
MDLISRHRNLTVLVLALFVQVVGLAVQVKRPTDHGPVRLVRLWGIDLIVPAEHVVMEAQGWMHNGWRNYLYLRDVRHENDRLQEENLRLRLELVRLAQDAGQAQRLQALLRFKEEVISETVAAQVIGTSGSENSRLIYIDKGANDGIKPDMAVVVPEGIVGKIIKVFPSMSQVLEINDQSSGVGALLEKARLQGILKGTPAGETMVHYIMADEKIEKGEPVVTSGGDRIFPKGLPIGRVVQVDPGPEAFLNIRVKPAATLNRLEEVLVITKIDEQQPDLIPEAPMRAVDILAQHLPGVPVKPPAPNPGQPGATAAPASTPPPSAGNSPVPPAGASPAAGAGKAKTEQKPATAVKNTAVPKKENPQ